VCTLASSNYSSPCRSISCMHARRWLLNTIVIITILPAVITYHIGIGNQSMCHIEIWGCFSLCILYFNQHHSVPQCTLLFFLAWRILLAQFVSFLYGNVFRHSCGVPLYIIPYAFNASLFNVNYIQTI